MTSESKAPGSPAVILFRQLDRDDNGKTTHEDNYFRVKILTEEGRKYADVEIPFEKGRQNVVAIKARTIRPDGTIAEFDGKVFEKTIVKAKGLKYLAKTFTLPDVQPGSIIEYSYTIYFEEDLLFDSRWILSQELFTRAAKFSLKPYNSGENRWFVQWQSTRLPGAAVAKEGPDGVIRLEATDIPAFPAEDYMPPENELKSRVNFIYQEEMPERDAARYWAKAGKRLNERMEKFVGKPKVLAQAVAQIVSPADTPEQKMRKIYARVQQLRNTSYEVEKTEQEEQRAKEKNARTAESVWTQGYGTGVQITWLYLALLRAAGLQVYGAMVSDRANYFFEPGLLDSSKLDANLVIVKADGKEYFCDPGAAFTPFGILPWTETGVKGLRLDKDGGSWIETPLPQSSMSRVERVAKLKLSAATGDLEGRLTVTFTGLEAERRRVDQRSADAAARKKSLEDEVREYVPAAVELELTNKPDWSASEPPLVAEFTFKVPGWAAAAGRRALLPVGLFSAPEKHVFDHAKRVHPIYFDFLSQKLDDVTIEVPEGWQVASVPKEITEDGHVVTYKLNVENGKRELHLRRKLSVDFLLLEPRYYASLRAFFQTVRTHDEEQIVLQPATSIASR